jgi:hypothetical protein
MITRTAIEKFYKDVHKLGLKFPVKEIQKQTGYGKPQVSEILSRKKDPSEAFINKFYAKFYPSSNEVLPETVESKVKDGAAQYAIKPTPGDATATLVESNRLIADSNRELAESNKLLARGNAELAESNKELAKSNADIIAKLKFTENAGQESPLTVQTILPGLLELLIDLGQGKLWDNKDQAETILNKRLFGHPKGNPSKRIQTDSGK